MYLKAFVFGMALTLLCSVVSTAVADETVVRSINLPGANLDQEVTYHPSQSEYEQTRDEILARLKRGDRSALVNPENGPWMKAETTAKIGLELKGVGAAQGRKYLRQISAADEALYLFDHPSHQK